MEISSVYVLRIEERHFKGGNLISFTESFSKVIGVYKDYSTAKQAAEYYCKQEDEKMNSVCITLDDQFKRWYVNNINNIVCERFFIDCKVIR